MSVVTGSRALRTAFAAAAVSVAVLAPQANASVFTIEERVSGDLFADTGKRAVSSNGISGNFLAGGFDLTSDGPLGDFIAFCLDIATKFTAPSDYEATDTPFTGNGQGTISDGAVAKIQNLYDAVYDTLKWNTQWAGFQFALWEIVSETDATLDATSGNFFQDYDNFHANKAAKKANQFLELAEAYDGPQKYRLIFLESQDGSDDGSARDSQNLVTVAAVPLPAAGILMLAALAGGAAAYRRRKAA